MTDLSLSTPPDLSSMRSMRSWSRLREATLALAAAHNSETPTKLATPTIALTTDTGAVSPAESPQAHTTVAKITGIT